MPVNHPRFCGHATCRVRDASSLEGAQVLARHIESVWRAAGHEVTAEVQPAHGADKHKQTFVIRLPGLVNGLPISATQET